jgi:hypothetical protein
MPKSIRVGQLWMITQKRNFSKISELLVEKEHNKCPETKPEIARQPMSRFES